MGLYYEDKVGLDYCISVFREGSFLDEIDYRVSEIFHVLGNGIRLHIVKLLTEKKWNVSDLSEELDRPLETVSGHLKKLRDQELIRAETQGRHHTYELKRPALIEHCLRTREFLSRDDRD